MLSTLGNYKKNKKKIPRKVSKASIESIHKWKRPSKCGTVYLVSSMHKFYLRNFKASNLILFHFGLIQGCLQPYLYQGRQQECSGTYTEMKKTFKNKDYMKIKY